MRLPEFTAEASLNRMSDAYRMVWTASDSTGKVLPALPSRTSCEWICARHPDSLLCLRCEVWYPDI
jgi:hypothetical protein